MTPFFDWSKIEPLIARYSFRRKDGNKAIRINRLVRDLHGHVTPQLRTAYILAIISHLAVQAHAGMPHTDRVYFVGDGQASMANPSTGKDSTNERHEGRA